METQNKRTLGDIVTDVGKGLGLITLGVGLGYIGVECASWAYNVFEESRIAGGSPPPIEAFALLYLPSFIASTGALGTAFTGAGKLFGYDLWKPEEPKESKPV